MAKRELKVDFPVGIHSRPAALLVKKVREYPDCKITFSHNGKTAIGNSLIGMLTLGAVQGSVVTLSVEGNNDEKVAEEIAEYFMISCQK